MGDIPTVVIVICAIMLLLIVWMVADLIRQSWRHQPVAKKDSRWTPQPDTRTDEDFVNWIHEQSRSENHDVHKMDDEGPTPPAKEPAPKKLVRHRRKIKRKVKRKS